MLVPGTSVGTNPLSATGSGGGIGRDTSLLIGLSTSLNTCT
jgi:hypothetical protein